MLAKIRCGVLPLHIETGRYLGTPEEERICFHCANTVESEEHFLISCDLYVDLRIELFANACDINPNFNQLSDCDKMCFLLSNEQICIKTAKILRLMFEKRRHNLYTQ